MIRHHSYSYFLVTLVYAWYWLAASVAAHSVYRDNKLYLGLYLVGDVVR